VVSKRSEVFRSCGDDSGSSSTSSDVSNSGPAGGTRKALATDAILQEKLSWYMDTVEVYPICSTSHGNVLACGGSNRRTKHIMPESSLV